MQILQALAVLSFVSVGALALGRVPYAWVRWAKMGSVVIFSLAFLFAVAIALRWALDAAP